MTSMKWIKCQLSVFHFFVDVSIFTLLSISIQPLTIIWYEQKKVELLVEKYVIFFFSFINVCILSLP